MLSRFTCHSERGEESPHFAHGRLREASVCESNSNNTFFATPRMTGSKIIANKQSFKGLQIQIRLIFAPSAPSAKSADSTLRIRGHRNAVFPSATQPTGPRSKLLARSHA